MNICYKCGQEIVGAIYWTNALHGNRHEVCPERPPQAVAAPAPGSADTPNPSAGQLGHSADKAFLSGVELIVAERQRQISQEGWTPQHDDGHRLCQLADAAACYIDGRRDYRQEKWPWAIHWWKPSGSRIRDLTKAGALIAAEIDRLQRLEARQTTTRSGGGACPPNTEVRNAGPDANK